MNDFEDYQELPQSISAEEALLGGLLIDPSPVHDVTEILGSADFFKADHRKIFAAIENLAATDDGIDVTTVLARTEGITLAHLVDLAGSSVGSANAKSYARVVRQHSIKRQVIAAATEVSKTAYNDTDLTAEELVGMAQGVMIDLDDKAGKGLRSFSINDILKLTVADIDRRFNSDEELEGLSCGIPSVDKLTNGLKPGELVLFAARPSMGKSTIALQMAANLGQEGHRGLFFSLEVGELPVGKKLLACIGKMHLNKINKPKDYMTESDWPLLEVAARRLKNSPLEFIDCPGISIGQIVSYARKAHRRKPIEYIFVDHLHLVTGAGRKEKRDELGDISSTLKRLSGELKIPVIALAQLNRGVEQRNDKRPINSDLRDSGTLEQDADIIMFVYRDDYYFEESPYKGIVEVYTKKVRNGELGKAQLANRFEMSRVDELEGWVKPEDPKPTSLRSIREKLA